MPTFASTSQFIDRSQPQLKVLFLLLASCIIAGAQTNITIDSRSGGRNFDGIGAVSAGASSRLLIDYPEPQRSQILDFLFKPDFGAALQHLKVEVGADVNSTDGSEPSHMRGREDHNYSRGYEWWLMKEAVKRNPKIILDILPWGAPGWISGGRLYSADMAEYIADFIEGAKKEGLNIQFAGIWNEKEYDSEYVKQLKRTLTTHRLTTQIVCCDDYPGEHQWKIAAEIQKDPELQHAVDILSVHYPQTEDGALTTTHAARISQKPLWSSEDQPNSGGGPILSRNWSVGGRILATVYNRNYLEGALTKTEIWSPITSYYDILAAPNSGLMYANTPWSGYFDVQSAIWVTAHTTQFTQPGWQYLDSASGYLPDGGTYVALRSSDGRHWSLIVESISAHRPQTINIRQASRFQSAKIHVWQTNVSHTFDHVADLSAENGSIQTTLEPDSLYTFTTLESGGRGATRIPSNLPFPLPYKDDFENYKAQQTPKYLSDQDGAFEVQPCLNKEGQCLGQVITKAPIPWGPLPDPFTLAGDVNWTDYSVAADFHFEDADAVTLIGRIDSADVFADNNAKYPSGYVFRMQASGEWSLLSAKYGRSPQILASGTARISDHPWHHFELAFAAATITAKLNGQELISVNDASHKHGMAGIGTTWGKAQFDNFHIAP